MSFFHLKPNTFPTLSFSGTISQHFNYSSPLFLPLSLFSMIFSCGVSWQQDHVSLDCRECGGYAMARPCPDCNGTCQSEWRRNLAAVSYNYNSFRFLSLHFLSPPFFSLLFSSEFFFILSNCFLLFQTIFYHLVLNLSSIHWSLSVFGPSVQMHIPNNVVFNHWLSFNFVQGFNKHTFVVFLDHSLSSFGNLPPSLFSLTF